MGAILSGWRYDISGISPDLRVDYEAHLYNCAHCRKRQRVHRTWDVMLLAITTLSFAAFLLAAVVMHRVEAISHISNVQHLHLHDQSAFAAADSQQHIDQPGSSGHRWRADLDAAVDAGHDYDADSEHGGSPVPRAHLAGAA